ncbi:MAG: Cna B-type domain-containing protein, partial [Lachnospiraceae bacterium]
EEIPPAEAVVLPVEKILKKEIISPEKPSSIVRQECVEVLPQGKVTITFTLPEPVGSGVKIYHVDEESQTLKDMDAQISAAGEVVMQTNHFSRFVMVSPKVSPVDTDYTTVNVKVDWIGGNAQIRPSSVIARLTSNNPQIPPSDIELNRENQWSYTWKDLPVRDSSGANITYYANQIPISGVNVERQYSGALDKIWIPTVTLTNKDTYLLVNKASVIKHYGMGNRNNPQNISAVELTVDNANINGVLTSGVKIPEIGCQWTASVLNGSVDAFYLQNHAAYLCQNKDTSGNPTTLGTSTTAQTSFIYTPEGKLISNAGTYVTRMGNSFTYTNNASQASNLVLLHEVPVDQEVHFVNNYQPLNSADGGTVEYHKRIDYLGDKAINPDTSLSGKDDHRLYLDVASGIKMPSDLILVLDVSGSMGKSQMNFLNRALMGTNGFVSRFLKAHPSNHLSIVYFWGATMGGWESGIRWAENTPLTFLGIPSGRDVGNATIYQSWMTQSSLPYNPILLTEGAGGTNYGAGLYQAQYLLDHPPSNPSQTKYMVFMSDGVPTHGLSTKKVTGAGPLMDRSQVFGQQNEFVPKNLHSSANILRYGTGGDANGNLAFCEGANITLARNFAASNPDLNIFSVDISNAASKVLLNLSSGTGRYLNAKSFEDLDATFASILGPGKVVISDTLSEYVNLLVERLDLKLTSKCDTTIKTLYENKTVTSAGQGVIQSVEVEPMTKKVTVTFVPTFVLEPNTVYTLSFNVCTTPKAYTDYGTFGYTDTGDVDTDYGKNQTSSNQQGFYSNNNQKATLTYAFGAGGTPVTKPYQKPVVQVIDTLQPTLPATGGQGTRGIFLVGYGCMLLAVVLVFIQLKNRKKITTSTL